VPFFPLTVRLVIFTEQDERAISSFSCLVHSLGAYFDIYLLILILHMFVRTLRNKQDGKRSAIARFILIDPKSFVIKPRFMICCNWKVLFLLIIHNGEEFWFSRL
jgi:hypothetical protein